MFETLNYEETAFNGKTLALTLEPGCYRLITSMRMPNGDQHAAYRVFELKAGEAKEIYLETVKKELDELLEHNRTAGDHAGGSGWKGAYPERSHQRRPDPFWPSSEPERSRPSMF